MTLSNVEWHHIHHHHSIVMLHSYMCPIHITPTLHKPYIYFKYSIYIYGVRNIYICWYIIKTFQNNIHLAVQIHLDILNYLQNIHYFYIFHENRLLNRGWSLERMRYSFGFWFLDWGFERFDDFQVSRLRFKVLLRDRWFDL